MLKKCADHQSSHINETKYTTEKFQGSPVDRPNSTGLFIKNNNNNESIYADLNTSKITRNQIQEPCNNSRYNRTNTQISNIKPRADPTKRLSCEELEHLKERFVDFIKPNNQNQIDLQ